MIYRHVEIHGGPDAGSFDCKEPFEIDLPKVKAVMYEGLFYRVGKAEDDVIHLEYEPVTTNN
jgi:hypothetical protein